MPDVSLIAQNIVRARVTKLEVEICTVIKKSAIKKPRLTKYAAEFQNEMKGLFPKGMPLPKRNDLVVKELVDLRTAEGVALA
jgi:hypothetical protein